MADKQCTKCGLSKPETDFYMKRPALGQRYGQCKSCWNEKTSKWWKDNQEKNAIYQAAWRDRAPEHQRAVWAEMKRRQRLRPARKFSMAMSAAVYISLSGLKRGASTWQLLGYSRQELMNHLERQFLPGMSWENYGEWHVDHIQPLSSFRFTGRDCPEFKAAWGLSNLRPLWARDNILKKDSRTHLL